MVHSLVGLLVMDAYLDQVFEAELKRTESGLQRRCITKRRHAERWHRLCFLDACEPII